ncbi:MAG TPA: ribosome maturation factor RimP [Propionibacteriaceae bacterium]|nr:ribosome maturation factor RimP [Propionibacteriaceae bacterium]
MNVARLRALLEPVLADRGLELDDLVVVGAGARSILRITVDGDGPHGRGPLLDEVADATRAVSDALDESDATGSQPYVLEVSSRGVGAPLTKPAHWRRNTGRLVAVTRSDGTKVTGRIVATTEEGATLTVDGTPQPLSYSDVKRAAVQVELNRPHDPDLDDAFDNEE